LRFVALGFLVLVVLGFLLFLVLFRWFLLCWFVFGLFSFFGLWGVVVSSRVVVSTGFKLVRDVCFDAWVSDVDFLVGERVVLPGFVVDGVRGFLGEHGVKWSGLFVVGDVVWLGSGERVVVLGVCEAGVLSVLGGVGFV